MIRGRDAGQAGALGELSGFRREFYRCLPARADALFELADAVLCADGNTVDLISGASANVGQIHDLVPFGGVVIHDSGLLRFDGNGNLTFEAGPHQGFNGDPTAIQEFCAALS